MSVVCFTSIPFCHFLYWDFALASFGLYPHEDVRGGIRHPLPADKDNSIHSIGIFLSLFCFCFMCHTWYCICTQKPTTVSQVCSLRCSFTFFGILESWKLDDILQRTLRIQGFFFCCSKMLVLAFFDCFHLPISSVFSIRI